MSFEKNKASQIGNKDISLGDSGNVKLPDWCAMQTTGCNPDESVMIEVRGLQFFTSTILNQTPKSKYPKMLHEGKC